MPRQDHLRKKYPLTRFSTWLEGRLLAPRTIRIMCATVRLIIEMTAGGLDPAAVFAFWKSAKSKQRQEQIVMSWRRWVQFNVEAGTGVPVANPFVKDGRMSTVLLDEFKEWLSEVRGVKPRTISAYCSAVRFVFKNTASAGTNVEEVMACGQKLRRNYQDPLIVAWRRFVEFSKAHGDDRYSDPFPLTDEEGNGHDSDGKPLNSVPPEVVEAIRALANGSKQVADLVQMRWWYDLVVNGEARLEVRISDPMHNHLDVNARPMQPYVFRLRLQPALAVLREWGGKGSPYPVVPAHPGAREPMDIDRLYRLLKRRHNVAEELALAKKMGEYERAHDDVGKRKSTAELTAESEAREKAARATIIEKEVAAEPATEESEDDLPMQFDL